MNLARNTRQHAAKPQREDKKSADHYHEPEVVEDGAGGVKLSHFYPDEKICKKIKKIRVLGRKALGYGIIFCGYEKIFAQLPFVPKRNVFDYEGARVMQG